LPAMNIPQHIGIIMDGNGRWAQRRGQQRSDGHRAGTEATKRTVRACGELGVKFLTIYVFSAENWARPTQEVNLLMDLLVEMTIKELTELQDNNVRLRTIGDFNKLPPKTQNTLQQAMEQTAQNTGLTLILAVSYGGRAEIVQAAKAIAQKALKNPEIVDKIDEALFASHLYTAQYPDPELIIRTGGDERISNFLLWQAAYSELFITDVLWPDFDKHLLTEAIAEFNRRERRFGKVLQ